MGYNTHEEYNYVGLHGRSVLDSLLGVKYFLCGTDSTYTMPQGYKTEPALAMDVAGVNVGAYEKSDALPIGYTSATRISRSDYEALTPIQRQDALLERRAAGGRLTAKVWPLPNLRVMSSSPMLRSP